MIYLWWLLTSTQAHKNNLLIIINKTYRFWFPTLQKQKVNEKKSNSKKNIKIILVFVIPRWLRLDLEALDFS